MWDPLTQPPKMTSQSLKYVVTIPQPKHALREPHRNLEIFLLSCWLQVSMLHAATLKHQSLLWLPNGTAATGMIETWNVPEKKFVYLFSVSASFGPGQKEPPTTSSTKSMYLAEKSCTKIVWVFQVTSVSIWWNREATFQQQNITSRDCNFESNCWATQAWSFTYPLWEAEDSKDEHDEHVGKESQHQLNMFHC